ncbi:HET-domain-containing protein [Stipitochalara longipes BDJ]|nr:HET-domain-containing protein [Stipitochalara longipes BDJ]
MELLWTQAEAEAINRRRLPFKYSPLNLGNDEIRLVAIHPHDGRYGRSENSAIYCDLEVVKLCDEPEYEALSYVWGPPEGMGWEIFIGTDFKLRVRENLWRALHVFQSDSDGTTRYLWIDALCIDQDDTNERNHQVAQMGKIYGHAKTVLAWLGPGNTKTYGVFELIRQISAHYNESGEFCGCRRCRRVDGTGVWQDLLQLCDREYWSRLWIIQEVVLAKDLLFVCGGEWFPKVYHVKWDELSQTLHALERLQNSRIPEVSWIRVSLAAQLERQRRARLANVAGSDLLYNLVISHKDAQCIDLRDKVFGLHSLTKDCCKAGTPVDYNIPPYVLCGRLLHHHFTHHRAPNSKIDIIHHSQSAHGIFKDAFYTGSDLPLPQHLNDTSGCLEALGNIRGAIIWECPINFHTKSEWTLRESSSNGRQPAMTTALSAQLNYVVQKLSLQWSSGTLAGDAINFGSMDVSTLAPRNRFFAVELPRGESNTLGDTTVVSQETQTLDTKIFATRRRSARLHPPPADVEPFPRSVLIRDVIVDLQDSRAQPRMFFEENGMIGFAPEGTQIGDLICQFKDSDVAVILRKEPEQGRFQIIGRAANAYSTGSPLGPFRCHTFPGGEVHQQISERPVLLNMDISTLQLLTSLPDRSLSLLTIGEPSVAEVKNVFSAEFTAVKAEALGPADIAHPRVSINLENPGDVPPISRWQTRNGKDELMLSNINDFSSETSTKKKRFSIRSISARLKRRLHISTSSLNF